MSRSSVGVITTLLIISVLAPGAVGGATAQEDDLVTMTVTVVDSNGDPVSNLDLTVTWNGGEGGPKNVTTTASGKVLVDVPNGSNVEIQVNDDEYVRNKPYVVFNANGGDVEVPVSLSGQATLSVQSASGPVPNAKIQLYDSGVSLSTLTTGPDGTVQTRQLEQKEYCLRVTKPGYVTNETTLSLTGNVTKDIRLRAGTTEVTFKVVDDHFSPPQPVADAQVSIPGISYSSRTFENGQTSTTVPVNRDYTVSISKEGYDSTARTFSVGENPRSVDLSIQREDDLSVQAVNDRVVVGESTRITVTDEYDTPVSGARVTANDQTIGRTDDAGQLDVPINSAGNVTVSVTEGGVSASVTIEGIEAGSDPTPEPSTPTPEPSTPTPAPTTPTPSTPEPTETEEGGDGETAGSSGPGFGVVATLAALGAAFVLARRR